MVDQFTLCIAPFFQCGILDYVHEANANKRTEKERGAEIDSMPFKYHCMMQQRQQQKEA